MMKPLAKKTLLSLVAMLLLGMTNQLAHAQSALYWTEMGANRIYKSTLEGTLTEMVRGVRNGTVLHIAVDPTTGKRYWTGQDLPPHRGAWSYGVVRSSNADGSNEQMIVGDFWDRYTRPMDVELDVSSGKIYWTDMGWPNPGIHRANLDGSFPEMLVDIRALQLTVNHGSGVGQTLEFGLTYNLALDLQNGKMCWTDYMAKDIHCSDLNGGGITREAFGLAGTPRGIDIDSTTGTMYWVTGNGGEVMRKEVGLNPEAIVSPNLGTDLDMPMDIDTDGQHLYFTDKAAGIIYRSNMDGTGVIVLNLRQYERIRPSKKTKIVSLEPLGIALAIEPLTPQQAQAAADLAAAQAAAAQAAADQVAVAQAAADQAAVAQAAAAQAAAAQLTGQQISIPRIPAVTYKVNKKGYGTWNLFVAASTTGIPTTYRVLVYDPANPVKTLELLSWHPTSSLATLKIKGMSLSSQGFPENGSYVVVTETLAGLRSTPRVLNVKRK